MKEYKLYAKFVKRSGLIGLLLLFSLVVRSQNNTYFNKTYTFFGGANSLSFGGIEKVDSNYIIVTNTLDYVDNWGVSSFLLSKEGSVLDSFIVLDTSKVISHTGGTCIQKISEQSYFYCGEVRDTAVNSLSKTFIAKFNKQADTVWTKQISLGNYAEEGYSIKYTGLDYLYLVGSTDVYGTDSFPITKIDTNGIVVWRKLLPGYLSGSISVGLETGIFYVGGSVKVGNWDYNGRVLKIDNNANLIWYKDIGVGGSRDGAIDVISYLDSGVIAIGDTGFVDVNLNEYWFPYVVRFDKDGKRLWTKDYFGVLTPLNGFKSGLIETDSTIIVTGHNFFVVDGYFRHFGIIAKINPNNGDLIWYRELHTCDTITSSGARHQLYDLIKSEDGGYVMVGWSNNDVCHGQETWVVKTNCLGFDEPPFANFYVNNLSHTYLSATFKNASTHCDEVIWNFGDGSSEIKVKTTDVDWTPTHVFPDEGSYTIKMTAFACGDTMEFERTIILDKALGSSELEVMNYELVFPNPFTDKLNLVGMEIGSEIEVRDVVGRVIYKGRIASSQTEINTSEWNNGTYFVLSTKGEQRSRGVYVKQ